MIALLAALPSEIAGLRRRMALAPEEIAGLCSPAYTGRYRDSSVLLICTGMGRQRAEASAEAVLARAQVDAVISLGFSGALERRLEVGDLVLASELMGTTGPGGDEIEPTIYRVEQGLLRLATEALGATQLRVMAGPTVTTPGIITTPAAKQELARQSAAIAVDMESYWIARAVTERGLPFLALRAISDAREELLPPLDQILDPDGKPDARRLAAHLIREPASLLSLARLARGAGLARRALTTGVACAVEAL